MRSFPARIALVALTAVAVFALAACGSSKSSSTSTSGSSSTGAATTAAKPTTAGASMVPTAGQKKGGEVTLLSSESFDHLDPAIAYFQLDYEVNFAVDRSLYYYAPQDSTKAIPDLATGPPTVSADGKTVTVKIHPGVKYGTNDPKSSIYGTTVKSADIKYAFERGMNPNIANPYISAYFPIVGIAKAKGGPVSGITTPNATTIVFHLTKNFGATMLQALTLPITIPMPKAYTAPYDKKNPSGLDADPTKQPFTGPYMIQSYSPGKSVVMVRNPEWNGPTTGDPRPAYLDKITWQLGADPNVAGRQIFNGKNLLNGDTPAAPIIKQFATKAPGQISFTNQGNRFIGLNVTRKPFSDLNVRKAAAAIMDRTAMQRVRGGAVVGDTANHFLPPGIPGFDQAGGMAGTGVDYLKYPAGNLQVAEAYMKKAGYASGKANGQTVVLFGDNTTPAKEDAEIEQNSLEKLGFNVQAHLVEHSVLISKYCGTKAQMQKIDVCANYGWLSDFPDPYAMLYVNFNGSNLPAVNLNDPSLFDSPAIDAAMDKGATITDTTQRAAAWGQIDRDLVSQVAAVPWFWDKTANIESSNVQGVIARWNAAWDLSYTSVK